MSSHEAKTTNIGKAELAFRDAFHRLKDGHPKLLPKGSPVTQNNVAREAGLDPSALKKARFPALVEEVKRWTEEFQQAASPTSRQVLVAQRSKNRTLKEQIQALKEQRDSAMSLLVEADAKILELTMENRRLRSLAPSSNVSHFPNRTRV